MVRGFWQFSSCDALRSVVWLVAVVATGHFLFSADREKSCVETLDWCYSIVIQCSCNSNKGERIYMLVPSRNKGQAQILLARLKKEYLMSQREVARYCGVNVCVVTKWSTGKYVANDGHLDKMREALALLAGRNVRYPKQAMDILEGRE